MKDRYSEKTLETKSYHGESSLYLIERSVAHIFPRRFHTPRRQKPQPSARALVSKKRPQHLPLGKRSIQLHQDLAPLKSGVT
ncbi:hypothetical protein TNCV_5077421 [Trichonephila clavipes]|uniref:Uncharacterized protein n=1 Tax=Trichonephila clavipes TaxID=2585209 RepID=A0A8X6RYJ5_TRICX|nr:hypothetical protein TNCV_5077421 [Trichonephila clavipes]